jgi:DNA-binding transcriptional ArsR family regulator
MPRSLSPAVLTALSILELLGAYQELGVTELARKLDMSKSSVHRLLNTLAHKGYIEKNPQTGRYRLTYQPAGTMPTYKNSPHQTVSTTPTEFWNDSCSAPKLTYAVEHGATGATSHLTSGAWGCTTGSVWWRGRVRRRAGARIARKGKEGCRGGAGAL